MRKELLLVKLSAAIWPCMLSAQGEGVEDYQYVTVDAHAERADAVHCGVSDLMIDGKLLYLEQSCGKYSDKLGGLSDLVVRVHAILPKWYKAALIKSTDCRVNVNNIDYTTLFSSWLHEKWEVGLNDNQVHYDIVELGLHVNVQFLEIAFLEQIYCESFKATDIFGSGRAKKIATEMQSAIDRPDMQ